MKFKATAGNIVATENTVLDRMLWERGLPSTLVQNTVYDGDLDLIVFLLLTGETINAGETEYVWRTS